MRQSFIPSTDSLPSSQREVVEHAATLDDARELAPWATTVIACDGGFRAFESADDAFTWERQS